MKTFISFFFCICFTLFSYSQTEALNQFDESNKKDGKWIVYLNKNWREVKDSSKATYYRYTFYNHGRDVYPMGPCGKNGWKLESIANTTQTGGLKLLDGEYKWFDKKGRIFSIHILKNGDYISCKEFYPSGLIHQHFNYTKKWGDLPHNWCISVYDKKGNFKKEYYVE
ncbi:MAG TPA: hypothetical protein VJI69_01775 [Bacteroidia bacterium]|nr:hypothetical protein [Bacteroidia bacterium]